MAIDTAIATFEEDNERILWLPSVTLAYLFTITGNTAQFVIAVAAIGGAQWFRLFINFDFSSKQGLKSPRNWFEENYSYLRLMPLVVLSLIYASATIYAVLGLYRHFTEQDIVLVGLGIVWWGIAIVVLVNTIAVVAKTDNA
ncbi:hypothetical protein [Halorubrum sp. BV1]|uniref:hypothetical protein n=1 Tax=Halorubrum sp. BV1 TaxID=1498500 RepID=UPI0012BB1A3D|nr:hypothetical protein [Halorubrum sp. BV1]